MRVAQPLLYRLHAGPRAGEYRPAVVQRAYDDGTADLCVFSRKSDGIDTTDNSFDVSRVKVYDDLCENGQACAVENTDRLKPITTRKAEPPKPAPPPVPVEEAPLAIDEDDAPPAGDDEDDE